MKKRWLWAIPLGAIMLALALVAWGPLLVTSPEEALSQVQGETALSFGGRTYGEIIRAHEATVGTQGKWEVERNLRYQSFFEGDEGGVLWIVTYDAPGTDRIPELEFHVKRFTGHLSQREPNWSFLPRSQLKEYLSKEKE